MSIFPQSIKIGTRGSQLALWQANWVKQQLAEHFPHLPVEITIIKTQGDQIQHTPLSKIGGKGLFVKEIEEALLNQAIDLAVHSLKDMPGQLPPGLIIGAIPVRETPWDAFVANPPVTLAELPKGAAVGTSSLRRSSQLLHQRPDLDIRPLRGNVDTRLAKLKKGEMAAIILAAAGLERLGFADRITEHLAPTTMLPAVSQGALGLEIRQSDHRLQEIVSALDHPESRLAITAERSFLKYLEGGCQVPIAAYAQIGGDRLSLDGLVADTTGQTVLRQTVSGPVEQAGQIGQELGQALLTAGAGEILKAIQESNQ